MVPNKSFYTPTISVPIPSTDNLLISLNETPITIEWTNLSPDHGRTSQKI